MTPAKIRRGSRLGKFRIERKLGSGGFATVYQAYDTIEGVRVALKIQHPHLVDKETLQVFRKEVRVNAQLDHPNIMPIKYAGFVDQHFVIVYPLGIETLDDRLSRRVSSDTLLDWFEQMLEAVAFAHRRRILHLDLKPENFILFPGGRVKLADFGLARVARRTLAASGSGTVGYLAPEQALGKPSLRSDVFSLGLIFCRMLGGELPEWPFRWPPAGHTRLKQRLSTALLRVIQRALEVDHHKRYPDAIHMLAAFRRAKARPGRKPARRRKRTAPPEPKWGKLRHREFLSRFGRKLETRHQCRACHGPVSEAMRACPWCGRERRTHGGPTRFPDRCGRCGRGRKKDWRFCTWCYGAGFEEVSTRRYADARYTGRCASCRSTRILPFSRYCPDCRRSLARRWPVPGSSKRCPRCRWGVVPDFWDWCPWCARRLAARRRSG